MKIVKNTLVFLLVAVLSGVAVLSCSDGKLNLLLVFRTERDEDDLPEFPPHYLLSSAVAKASSSSAAPSSSSEEVSSSSKEEISSSSEEAPPSSSSSAPSSSSVQSSSSVPPPSSGRGPRSSSSKAYIDYPTLEVGASEVKKGWASRYWDGCKPHCSWPDNVETSEPWAICRNCDRDNKEMPAYFLHPDASPGGWAGMYLGTGNACENNKAHEDLWRRSPAYTEWKAKNPAYSGSAAYTCWDMTPYVINDTLAYAFAATPKDGVNRCGKCYQLQFDGDDQKNPGRGRDTHRAIKGKTLIVLSSNTGGLEPNQFDIMIPGGGLGDFDAFTEQTGVSKSDLGETFGGLLSTCIFGVDYYKTSMEVLQECVREKCNKIFGTKARAFLDGCLFMADWYMAADNPTLVYKEIDCPQYLTDKYRSTIQTEKPPPLW